MDSPDCTDGNRRSSFSALKYCGLGLQLLISRAFFSRGFIYGYKVCEFCNFKASLRTPTVRGYAFLHFRRLLT